MLEENSALHHEQSLPVERLEPTLNPRIHALRQAVDKVMLVEQENKPELRNLVVQFAGPQLLVESSQVLETIEPTLRRGGVHAYFSYDEQNQLYLITVLEGRFEVKPRSWIPNAVLFILTLMSLFLTGALIQAGVDGRDVNRLEDIRLWQGWQYAFSLILILGAHELGHYFMARRHNVNVTLPYFIPMPFIGLFGTMGAFIQLREPLKNRNNLFDVGVAGPLAGVIFAIPILLLGLATSQVQMTPSGETFMREGNSILYYLAKFVVFGRFLPHGNEDVFINQFAQAGWTGLFVTALNLIPVGQLDGGHVMYTLWGRRARRIFMPIILMLGVLAFYYPSWLLWTIILLVLGRTYAIPLDDVTPLSQKRRWLGYLALLIFVLTFVYNPMEIING
jgi:Zn-dependent protease